MNKRRVTPLINRIYLFWPLFKKIISRSDYDPLKAEWIITTQRSLLLNKHTLTHSCDSVPTSVRLLYFLFTHSCFPTYLLRIQSGTIWVFVSLWVKYVWKPLRVCVSRYGVTNLSNLSACCFVHPSYYLLIWAVFRPSVICPSLDYRTDKDRESFFFFFKKWSQTLHRIISSRQITHESLLICLPLCPICPSGSNAPLGSAVRPDQLLDPPLIIGQIKKNKKRGEIDLQGTGRKWHTENCRPLNPCSDLWQFTNMDEER